MTSNRWVVLGALFIARSALGYHFVSVASVAPLMAEDLGLNFAEIGTLIGSFSILGVVSALPAGFLGRRFGERRVCLAGLCIMGVGGLIMWLGGGFVMIGAGRIIAGTGGVVLTVVMVKLVGDLFEGREVVTGMAILMNSWPVGIAIGLWTQGALAEAWGWQAVFLAASIGSFAGMALVAVLYQPQRWRRPAKPPPAAPEPRAEPDRRTGRISRREVTLVSLAGGVWVFMNGGFLMVLSFGPAMLVAGGDDVAGAGLRVSNASVVYMIAIPLGGMLSERLARPNLVMISCMALAAVTLALVPVVDSPVLLFMLVAVFVGIPTGNVISLTVETVRAEHRSLGTGIYYTWNHIAQATIPVLAGWVVDLTGKPSMAMFVGGTTVTLAMCLLLTLRGIQRRGSGLPI